MRRLACWILAFLCLPTVFAADFDAGVVSLVEDHAVAIAVYYYMDDAEYQKRIVGMRRWQDWGIRDLAQMLPLGATDERTKCIAYIGAGGILKDNHIITVRHLFNHDENTIGSTIYVFQHRQNHAIEAEIVAVSAGTDYSDDYAVIRLKEDLGFKGLRISKKEAPLGSPVIFIGSTGGLAFHKRFGFISDAQRYFRKDIDDVLHLSMWEQFKYLMVFPSGPGDSGGFIANKKGEIVGILYCGIEVYAEHYCFSNPIQNLWDFLRANKLEYLGR